MTPSAHPAPEPTRSCPRTGRSRTAALAPGAVRPSDLLVAFFACATALLVLAAATALVGALAELPRARWLAVHLAFVGGVSQLVLGAAQFFVCAFLATEPPSRHMVRAQLGVWNAGVLAIAIGVPTDAAALTGAGGLLILVGLGLFAAALRDMERRSLQRAPWAACWYRTAAAFFAVGALLGPAMAAGLAWPHGSLLAAHLVLNLGGWFGTAIVGTLHTFYPSLTGTRLRWPALQPCTFACWTAGIAILAAASAFDAHVLAVVGWEALFLAAVLLGANLLASARNAQQQTSAATLVGSAQLLLPLALFVAQVVTILDGTTAALLGEHRAVAAALAVAGWIGLTVFGSLLHLLALMVRVRGLGTAGALGQPAAPTRTIPAAAPIVAVVAVTALAVTQVVEFGVAANAAGALVATVYLALGTRVVILALRAVRVVPMRI